MNYKRGLSLAAAATNAKSPWNAPWRTAPTDALRSETLCGPSERKRDLSPAAVATPLSALPAVSSEPQVLICHRAGNRLTLCNAMANGRVSSRTLISLDRGDVPTWPVDERFPRAILTFARIKYASTGWERPSYAWFTDRWRSTSSFTQ